MILEKCRAYFERTKDSNSMDIEHSPLCPSFLS